MNNEIEKYNALQTEEDRNICKKLMNEINKSLTNAEIKKWHGNPVWFIEGNPIVGYSSVNTFYYDLDTLKETEVRGLSSI